MRCHLNNTRKGGSQIGLHCHCNNGTDTYGFCLCKERNGIVNINSHECTQKGNVAHLICNRTKELKDEQERKKKERGREGTL